MASTATSRIRLDKQATYDNPETWGIRLNSGMIDMVDDAFGGSAVEVEGDVTLTVENYTADQARSMFLMLSGAGGFDITVPAVDKLYFVINDCADDVTITPLSGEGATVPAGSSVWWHCDGTDGFVWDPLAQAKAHTDAKLPGTITISTSAPTGGSDGDIHFRVLP